MALLVQKFRQSLSTNINTAFVVVFLYGVALLFILFNTVHDRSDEEFRNRQIPRWNNAIMVWIDYGYFTHGGLNFQRPVKDFPQQQVWSSITMGFVQLAHIIQRANIAITGEFSHFLMALHNQVVPMFSSVLLGFLALRLSLQLGISSSHALILGVSVLTVYQTFPANLAAVWEIQPAHVWQFFSLLFLVMEERFNWRGFAEQHKIIWSLVVFFMFYVDPYVTICFMVSYYIILLITKPAEMESFKFIKSSFIAGGCAVLIMAIQINWVKFCCPQVSLKGSPLIYRTGLDGDIQYYLSHLDLIINIYGPWLPKWKVLLFFGTLAIVAVICLAQWKRKFLSHQTALLAGLGAFVPMAFFFSQNGVIHPYVYAHIWVLPMILALFALLPAWLETFNKHSGTFVLFSALTAFAFAGYQMLSYWFYMPPFVWY